MKGLILDDDSSVCEYIASVLEESGVEYEAFLDPVEALGQMSGGEYDFAFVDINLPNMDGLEFSRRFKSRFPEADVIVITGHGDYEKAVQAIKVGAYDYIQKAFRRLDIVLCVARLIEKRQLYKDQKRMELLKFANDVALELMHELRNPLVAIGGFSKLISTKDLPEDRLRGFAGIVFEESVRLEAVLKEILDHLKAGAKRRGMGDESPHFGILNKNEAGKTLDRVATTKGTRGTGESLDVGDIERRGKMVKPKREKTARKEAKISKRKAAIKTSPSRETAVAGNGIKKRYLSGKDVCEVTFRLPKIAAPDAEMVCIVGDFNDWDIQSNRMKRLKNGDYTIKLNLEPGKDYEFRYLINESQWENDWNADSYVKSPFGGTDNSVVKV
jgi:CheY-like chemotaxis protein